MLRAMRARDIGGAVDTAHVEALEDDLVELGIRTAREEAVELHKEAKVHVLRAGLHSVLVPNIASAGSDVNTHC